MSDDLVPSKIYDVRLFNPDLQKEQEDRFLAKNVRIGNSGALEFDRVFTDSDTTYKGFYVGDYYVTEVDPEDFEEMKHHHHDEEEDDE